MTIALVARVFDGIVFAADSASTIMFNVDNCSHLHPQNVFNNGEKITNLHRLLPLGMITWGLGTVDTHSINWHGKELRRRFEGQDSRFADWDVDITNYQLLEIAERIREYFLEFPGFAKPTLSPFGLLIAGYSSDNGIPEAYSIESVHSLQPQLVASTTPDPTTPDPTTLVGLTIPVERLKRDEVILFFGQPEALERLTLGYSSSIGIPLKMMGVKPEDLDGILSIIRKQTLNTLVTPTMPIQDVIDLAHFLVDTTIKYVRFSAGPNTVGGSIDLAAITRHEGFKWVNRKHYFPSELNPRS